MRLGKKDSTGKAPSDLCTVRPNGVLHIQGQQLGFALVVQWCVAHTGGQQLGFALVCCTYSSTERTKANPRCYPLRPRTTPSPEEKSIPGVIYGVFLWVDMNAATPLGAWGRSVISLENAAYGTDVPSLYNGSLRAG